MSDDGDMCSLARKDASFLATDVLDDTSAMAYLRAGHHGPKAAQHSDGVRTFEWKIKAKLHFRTLSNRNMVTYFESCDLLGKR
jgi:hypothetical protein